MPKPADTARWAILAAATRGIAALARRSGDPVGSALFDDDFLVDPYRYYEDLRGRGRMATSRFIWLTADHALCREILRDDRFVKPQPGSSDVPWVIRVVDRLADPKVAHPLLPPSMLSVNPPEHTRYRTLVSKAFTPRAVEALRPRVRELADELLSAASAGGGFDLVGDYAGLLPVAVICEVLGVPGGDRARFRALGAKVARMLDVDLTLAEYTGAMDAVRELNAFFDAQLARVRREPGDDMLSRMAQVVDDGDRLTDHELKATALLLLVAGFETTVNLVGNGLVTLFAHPEQRSALRDDESLWPNAVEEMLRYDSPVQYTGRMAATDVDVDGVHVPKGRMVGTLLGGANHDPAVFADPYRFDVTRPNARDHLAFAAGVHYCLGASLARLEGQVALQTLLTRFPDAEITGTPRRRRTRLLRGYDSVPLRLAGRPVYA